MQLTQIAHMGEEGHNFCGKRTFTNVIFDVQISQIKASEDIATATSTLDVLYPALMGLRQYISAWAIELLILVRGNARARTWDKRSRAPTSFRINITNR